MKVSVILCAVLAFSVFVADASNASEKAHSFINKVLDRFHPNDEKVIDEVNSSNLTWKAGKNAVWDIYNEDDFPKFMGTQLEQDDKMATDIPRVSLLTAEDGAPMKADIPETFDSREHFKGYIHPIRNQMRCGSCWAFAASEALSDRFAIASQGEVDVVLSPEDMVSCDYTDNGCNGGMIPNAWNYLANTGIVSDKCFPYEAGSGNAPKCIKSCEDGEAFKKYKAKNVVHLTTVEAIQQAIMTGGPVEAGFMVHKSFMSYKSGVYQHKWFKFWDSILGGHAVKIVGWGTEDGVPYWLVANSWSTDWGLDGYFKILRGKNDCQFESSVYAGVPVLD